MNLIDTHCHLYLPEFDMEIDQLLQRARENDVHTILLPAIDNETHQRLLNLCDKTDSHINLLPMMGLHPCSVNEGYKAELDIVRTNLANGKKYFAVGEIGLDFYWDLTYKQQQLAAFDDQINLAIELNLPIAIHSRNATSDCIASVKPYAGKSRGVFHCFSGSIEEANAVIDLGFYVGIGGVVTYKNTNLREILKFIGLQNVVLETDAPYLSPTPHRGKRNEPSYLRLIAEAVALATDKTLEEVCEITSANAKQLFTLA